MIRYRSTLENIAALAHIDRGRGFSTNEALRRFVMIEQLANKALYSPGQPRSGDHLAQPRKLRVRSQPARGRK